MTLLSQSIEAGGVRVPVAHGGLGPQILAQPPFEALGWVTTMWITGKLPDLLGKVERGEDAEVDGFAAVTPTAQLEPEELAAWRELTGADVGDDPVYVYARFVRYGMAFPRAALVEILRAFKALREEAAIQPRIVYPPAPPPPPDAPLPPKQLFCRTPSADQPPSERERLALADVEDLAVAADLAQAGATTPDARAAASVKRRLVLGELEANGLLDEARVHEKRAFLEGWRMPVLRDYVDAAIALRAYYGSAARATYALPPPPARLLDGAVALDWFRRPSATPEGATPDTWLAFCEQMLKENAPATGAAGEVLSRVGGRWYQIQWRRDDGDHPVVVAASELVR